jgi:hypothetical protein
MRGALKKHLQRRNSQFLRAAECWLQRPLQKIARAPLQQTRYIFFSFLL